MTTPAVSALIKQNVTYLDLVAGTILVYDYLLTVEREVRLVWPVPWTAGKVLFFLTRYPVFVDTFMVLYQQFTILTPQGCQNLCRSIGFLLGFGTLIAEAILALRTWVIWDRDRRIGIFLVVTLVLLWVPIFYFLKLALYSLVFSSPPHPKLPGCFLENQSTILCLVFILIMTFETMVVTLTVVKGYEHCRRQHTTLISVLYRDGILNYIYICLLSIINVVVLLAAPHGYSTLLTATQRAFHSILSARILLHLRQAAVKRLHSMSLTTQTWQGQNSTSDFPHARSKPSGSPVTGVDKGPGSLFRPASRTTTNDNEDEFNTENISGQTEEGLIPDMVAWFGESREHVKESDVPLVGMAL